ncbi:MAG TPA: transglutaminase-like domain-containing protein [Candidatus Eisenbacteria bacterium]|nr:transglutaminase-like domain-containing protein [Candidatus Eisenbacteria bacterium]
MAEPDPHRSVLQGFAGLVEPSREDASIDLAAAALAIARTEYPLLDVPCYLRRLESLAERVRSRMRSNPTARETIALLNRVLFDEEGLRGNRDDYYDPRNSFLNDVLDRKLGIPITLSVIYMDVARRIGFPLAGTGMPGHFLLKHFDVISGQILIDAFHRGRIVGRSECQQRLNEIYSGQVELQPEFLQAVTHRDILTRMLNNLRQIYFTQRNFRKGLVVLDLLLAIPPQSADLLRERGLVRLNLEQYLAAARDLGAYLKLQPEAPEAEDVRETLEVLRQLLATLN